MPSFRPTAIRKRTPSLSASHKSRDTEEVFIKTARSEIGTLQLQRTPPPSLSDPTKSKFDGTNSTGA